MIPVKVKKLKNFEGKLPKYETKQSAGMDIRSMELWVELEPSERKLFKTGLSVEIPAGYEIQVRPRSGLALKSGIMVVNSPGTIDADYRGEIGVILLNTGEDTFTVAKGDRIAQLVLSQVPQMMLIEEDELTETERGNGGFGSTGAQ